MRSKNLTDATDKMAVWSEMTVRKELLELRDECIELFDEFWDSLDW